MNQYKVIALCGNDKFKKEILREYNRLTLNGNLVIFPAAFNRPYEKLDSVEQLLIQRLNYQKIEMSDEVYIVNKNGYSDELLKLEIQYAAILKKPVIYMEKVHEN